ncbi:hypothetical protein DICPUDRAFT_79308 [Dictyostelium purpureum]|uniref:Uncharacterized protein n=1 Tax=Dictyostelium purpureum TaxID=5786 RepID=F0ZM71_DICPU|nr:uncharacterized protein DICPUDRAFT_79308 [Dictyostelium purpureum]EGC34990.1 hypothetical protein DICPUDRAFT_79308 [Dictyostelium purpureum]|eukprot:XP_003288515.1 hypothetical protein DICPUDRAFT_79308 [Dictyostelium purpureum]
MVNSRLIAIKKQKKKAHTNNSNNNNNNNPQQPQQPQQPQSQQQKKAPQQKQPQQKQTIYKEREKKIDEDFTKGIDHINSEFFNNLDINDILKDNNFMDQLQGQMLNNPDKFIKGIKEQLLLLAQRGDCDVPEPNKINDLFATENLVEILKTGFGNLVEDANKNSDNNDSSSSIDIKDTN